MTEKNQEYHNDDIVFDEYDNASELESDLKYQKKISKAKKLKKANLKNLKSKDKLIEDEER